MGLFRKKPTRRDTAKIQWPSVRCSEEGTPCFLTNEEVRGSMLFELPVGSDFTYKIALKGTVSVRTEIYNPGGLQKDWRLDKRNFLSVTSGGSSQATSSVTSVPFSFNLRDCESSSQIIPELPPSLDSREESKRLPFLQRHESNFDYNIAYSVVASASSCGKLIAAITTPISIIPIHQDQHTLAETGVPPEYHWADPVHLRREKKTNVTIQVAAQEPEPIILCPYKDVSNEATEVCFVLRFTARDFGSFIEDSPPNQCRLAADLITKTQVTPDGVELLGAFGDHIRYHGSHQAHEYQSHRQNFTVQIPQWEKYDSNPSEHFALARFSFLFTLTGKSPPAPNLFTPLLSRRYGIEFTMSFPNTSSSAMKLSLPVEIRYETQDIDSCNGRIKTPMPVLESRI